MKNIYIQTYYNNNNKKKRKKKEKKKKFYTPMRVHTRTRLHNNEDTKIY